jgi:hypothetical protein
MNTSHHKALLLACAIACVASPAEAADRMRAGQWTGTTTIPGRTIPNSSCISQSDADAMNGDAKSVQTYLQTIIPPTICKLSDVKVNGGQVVYTSVCAGGAPNVVTTNYHGDRSEGSSTGGAKSEAKWVGACK